jgi:putative membrane protein
MLSFRSLLPGLLALLALGACQQSAKTDQPAAARSAACTLDPFGCSKMPLVGCAGIFEVEAGRIAAEHATRPEVRAYAAQMVQEHGTLNEGYRALMRRKGLVPPDTTLRAYRQKIDSLRQLPPDQLDARYARMMVADHRRAVGLFGQAAENARDEEYKQWLVARHADHAQALYDGLTQPPQAAARR